MTTIKISSDYYQDEYIILESRTIDESYLDYTCHPVFQSRSEYVIVLEKLEYKKAVVYVYDYVNGYGSRRVKYKDDRCEIEGLKLECLVDDGDLKIQGKASTVRIKKETA